MTSNERRGLSDPEMLELATSWPLFERFNVAPGSLCVVAGAYKGKVMQLLADYYMPGMIMGYEPQLWAAALARRRLAAYENCRVVGYALGTSYGVQPMGEFFTDACSFVNTGPDSREQGSGEMRDAAVVFSSILRGADWRTDGPRGIVTDVELFVCNMEGYEYELLPYLVKRGVTLQIKKLAVQFHQGFGNDGKLQQLLDSLDDTHDRVVDEFPSWIYWERKAR